MMYFVARDGQQYGPYSAETIRQYLAAGSLLPSDHAREETAQAWSTLGQYFPPVAQTPVPPQPYTSGPAYGQQQPMYAQPPMVQQQTTGPQIMPPDLHWALVLLLSFTWVFSFIWALMQASYARKLDPNSKATIYYIIWTIGSVIYLGLYVALIATLVQNNMQPTGAMGGIGIMMFLAGFGSVAFFIAGTFSIRASMLEYYNNQEPIQLRLSGVMTFFFSIMYLQYHMSRIAAWKKTGYLSA